MTLRTCYIYHIIIICLRFPVFQMGWQPWQKQIKGWVFFPAWAPTSCDELLAEAKVLVSQVLPSLHTFQHLQTNDWENLSPRIGCHQAVFVICRRVVCQETDVCISWLPRSNSPCIHPCSFSSSLSSSLKTKWNWGRRRRSTSRKCVGGNAMLPTQPITIFVVYIAFWGGAGQAMA